MDIKDLLKLLEHHWLHDRSVFLHERQRVQLSALILILAYTLARPGAIIDSGCAVGTNTALTYGNVRVFIIRNPSKPDRNVIALEVTLFLPKGHQGEQKQRPVTYLLHEDDDDLVLCPVLQFLALDFDDRAFEASSITCPADLYRHQVPENEDALHVRWKEPMLDIPIFRCADRYGGVIRTSSDKALSHGDFQEFLRRLGRNAGSRQELTPYCFREGAANILDKNFTSAERTQIIGHSQSSVYQFYYQSRLSPDIQSAYLGEPILRDLHRAADRMRLLCDPQAPSTPTQSQGKERYALPELNTLPEEVAAKKLDLIAAHGTLTKAKGSELRPPSIAVRQQ